MSALSHPQVSRSRAFPLIWIVPAVALAISGWMLYRALFDQGPEITIEFAAGPGIEANKTVLEYKGVAVGMVKAAALKQDLSGVVVRLRLDKNAASLAATGSQFWIVHPEIGLGGVRGLDTLLSGARLNVKPGQGPPTDHFRGLDQTPAPDNPKEGRAFILRSDRMSSLSIGAPVNFRELKVGEVEAITLSDDSTSILTRIRVEKAYAGLVRSNSQFWNAGGVSIKLSLFGAQIRSTSLESIATGAVGFATPDQPGALAKDGAQFELNADVAKEWLKWHPNIPIQPPAATGADKPEHGPILSLAH